MRRSGMTRVSERLLVVLQIRVHPKRSGHQSRSHLYTGRDKVGFRSADNHRWAQLLCLFAVFLFLPFTVMCASLQTGKQGMGQKVKVGQISI